MALQELVSNPLRSFFTLLGITIGIFCIISILTGVNFLNRSIENSIKELGQDVIYVDKFPWSFSNTEYPWWEYMKRPDVVYDDYKFLKERSQTTSALTFFIYLDTEPARFRDQYAKRVEILGVNSGMSEIMNIKLRHGRFINSMEDRGSNVAVIGENVSEKLFGKDVNPVGETIRLRGRKVRIIGLIKEEDNLIDFIEWKDSLVIPYEFASSFYYIPKKGASTWIACKAKDGISLDQMKEEVKTLLRAYRGVRPIQDENFALNKVTSFLEAIKSTQDMLRMTGFVLGFLSLLIGGFGVANIMFVTVKERTRYIGIKKAIGAKQWVILTEFLIESIILCLLGSLFGLFLVYILALFASNVLGQEFILTRENILLGISISVIIGILSGFLPALQAARMNPVNAIRS